MKQCTVDGCDLPMYGGGWCRKHHERNRKFGNPLAGQDRSRPLSERFNEKVTRDGNGCWRWTGTRDRHGYGQIRVSKRLVYAHRVSFELVHGPIPEGKVIDHMCFTPECVNPDHLRAVSRQENNEHRQGAMSNNKSTGVRNVYPKGAKWQVRIKNKSYGVYATLQEAATAASRTRATIFTHDDGRIAAFAGQKENH